LAGKLLLIGIIGFAAQLIDGALGMAYGVSSTTLLLAIGSAPAVASATVHLAEVGTVSVSALSHWRFGNVEWRCVRLMSLPGLRSSTRPGWRRPRPSSPTPRSA
jgi:uncharacterized protein